MNALWDRMKAWLSPGGHEPARPGRPRTPGGRPVRGLPRRASARAGPRTSRTDWRKLLAGDKHSDVAVPVEQACPSCGAPMLAGWGASCGKCKPKFASPKTVLLATGDVAGLLSMTLGWLVVLKTPEPTGQKRLLDLTDPTVILTRAGGTGPPGARLIEFADEYMSVGHAVLHRPQGFSPDAAFTIEDRKNPGPSANGTFVNGRRLQPGETVSLGDGDLIRVGTTEVNFKSLWLPASANVRS